MAYLAAADGGGAASRVMAQVVCTEAAPVTARVLAVVPGARWDRPGKTCGLLQLLVDGAYHQDLILVHGEVPSVYERLIGVLAAGVHTLEVRPHPEAPELPAASVSRLEGVIVRPQDAAEDLALREAPWIYTRAETDPWESLWTDVPLLLFYRPRDGGVEFQLLYSNEDAGTDTRGLLALWGRTTDIEWVLHVQPSGQATIQGLGHHTEIHSEHRVAGRRTLQVAGRHGMVSSRPPWGRLRALFVPGPRWDDALPRESVMSAVPWTFALTAAEMRREGKLDPGSPATDPRPGDLRQYAFVQLLRAGPASPPTGLEVIAELADGQAFSSTHGESRLACARPAPFSTTIKLPSGAAVRRLVARAVPGPPSGPLRLQLHQAFRLGPDDLPQEPFARGAPVTLAPGAAEVTLWQA